MYKASRCPRCCQRVWVSKGDVGGLCRRCNMDLADPSQCGICFDPVLDRVRYVRVSNESWDNTGCSHSGKFCRGCLQNYLRSKLTDGSWNIRCPAIGCSYLMLEADMSRILATGTSIAATDPLGKALSATPMLGAEECISLLHKFRQLREVDHRGYLQAVLRMLGAAASIRDQPKEHVGEEVDSPSEPPQDVDMETHQDMEMAATGDDTQAEVHERSLVNLSEAERLRQPERNTGPALVEMGFGVWAVGSCQACPHCLVIVRKETGCNHIQCRCGGSFCYGCGAPDHPDLSKQCLCKSSRAISNKFCLWLQESGKLDAVEPPNAAVLACGQV